MRRVSDTVVRVELTFDGTDFDTDAPLTFTVGAAAVADYTGVALTAQVPVTALEETVTTSTPAPLTEVTLDESVVTLTLSGRVYGSRSTVENNVTVSGIDGVTIGTDGINRESDTAITVELEFDGNLVADALLRFSVGAGAIANYNGSALVAILPVTTVEENSIIVSLKKVGADQFKAIASSGAPFDIVLPISVTNGRITGGATTVTIPKDSVESEPLTVTRTPGTSDDITVDIGTLPGIPATHPGYSLVKSTDLPLTFITYAETSLMAIKGTITSEDGSAAEAGLQVTVTIGSHTKTATLEVGGGYTVIFLVLQGVVATSEDTVTVEVLSDTTGASVEHTGPLSPEQIVAKQATVDLQFPSVGGAVFTPVSERTAQVRDAIVAAVPGINSANDVTVAHLAAIHTLSLSRQSITTLKAGDFDGFTALATLTLNNTALSTLPAGIFDKLTALTTLALNNTNLSTLPAGIFDKLTALTTLALNNTALSTLPAGLFDKLTALTTLALNNTALSTLPSGIFDKLTALTTLTLNNTALSTLPAGIFDKLTGLTTLALNNTALSSLPAGIFDKLTALTTLALNNTALSTLPAGLFEGLTALTNLTLHGNAVDPLPLTVSLEQVEVNQFKAVAPTGAPFEIVLPLIVANGTIDGGATAITIPKGRVESAPLTVTRTAGATGAISVDIGAPLPVRPVSHTGYTLVKSDDLPLTFITFAETSLMAIKGTVTYEDGTPAEAGLQVTVTIGSNTQTVDSKAGGVYSVIFANFLGVVATSEDTVTIEVLRQATGASVEHTGPLSPEQIIAKQATIDLQFPSLGGDVFTPVSKRTPQVRDAIVATVQGVNSANDVTAAHLAAIKTLSLSSQSITTLKAGDFDGFTALTRLDLNGNALSTLPSGIFDNLTGLTTLTLNNTALSTLPSGIFDNLTGLTTLILNNTALSTLPSGIFDNLTALTTLALNNTALSTLPAGLFEGLTALTNLTLHGNAVDPLPLTVSLAQVGANLGANQFKAVAPTGAPFGIVLPLTVANGTIDGGATAITIPKGRVESAPLTVTRTPGTTDAISVDIGAPLPVRPVSHTGYTLVKSDDLPLTFITFAETSLMAIKGTVTYEDGTPAEAGLQITVTIGSNTQTVDSKADGVYTVIFANFLGVVATSEDTVTVAVLSDTTGASVEQTVPLSPEQIVAKQATIDLQFTPTPSTTDRKYLLSVPKGISLIHVPLKVTAVDGVAQTIESVGDLYDALGGAATVSLLITYDPETGRWISYLHDGYRGRPGDKTLTDDLGIVASMKVAKSVLLSGDALGTNGRSSITLHPGMNLVGVPFERFTDNPRERPIEAERDCGQRFCDNCVR